MRATRSRPVFLGLGALLITLTVSTRSAAQTQAPEPIYVEQVLRSVEMHHPQIRAAVARLQRAQGDALSARGAFDPRLKASGDVLTGGYYELRRVDVELLQPTPIWGTDLYAGYRLGLGVEDERFPSYYPWETLEGGEVRAGIRIPLWRDGVFDPRRAARQRTALLRDAAEDGVAGAQLDLLLRGAESYWRTVAAGQAVGVAEALLQLAETRQEQIEQRQEQGAVARITVLDNERALFDRQRKLVVARRKFAKAAFNLSLFLRNSDGAPVRATEEELPSDIAPPEPPPLQVDDVADTLVSCHPKVRQLQGKLAAARVSRRLARTQVAPEIAADFEVSRDLGDATRNITLPGTNFKAGVLFSMPLPLRKARGKARAASAKVTALEQRLRFLRDRLQAKTRDLATRVRAALERLTVAKDLRSRAEDLAEAERQRFQLGAGTLLTVNIREQAAADAQLDYLQANTDAWASWTAWRTLAAVEC